MSYLENTQFTVTDELLDLIDTLPRFIRINPNPLNTISISDLRKEIKAFNDDFIIQETSLSDFYQLSANTKMCHLPSFKSGKIFGMDIASGICVHLLMNGNQSQSSKTEEHILDICCAPGMKLLYIAQLLMDYKNPHFSFKGTVTGVDISHQRLNVCKKKIRQLRIPNVRIFQSDGCTFHERSPSMFNHWSFLNIDNVRNNHSFVIHKSCWNQKMWRKQRKKIKKQKKKRKKMKIGMESKMDDNENSINLFYDRILVDAQCTHDGSIRHLKKYRDEWGWDKWNERVLNENNIQQTIALQKKLIENAFSLLNGNGGILIYSTCSLDIRQNECIVRYLIAKFPAFAHLCSLNSNDFYSQNSCDILFDIQYENGRLVMESDAGTIFDTRKCIRFNPVKSHTSALFIAKIVKKLKNNLEKASLCSII